MVGLWGPTGEDPTDAESVQATRATQAHLGAAFETVSHRSGHREHVEIGRAVG